MELSYFTFGEIPSWSCGFGSCILSSPKTVSFSPTIFPELGHFCFFLNKMPLLRQFFANLLLLFQMTHGRWNQLQYKILTSQKCQSSSTPIVKNLLLLKNVGHSNTRCKGPFYTGDFCRSKVASSFKHVRNPRDIAATNRTENCSWFTRAILQWHL